MSIELQQAGRFETGLRSLVRWGLYPASWAVLLVGIYGIVTTDGGPASIWAKSVGFLVPVYLLIEIMLPYQKRWAMTWASFLADLKFVVTNGAFGAAISAGLAWFAITTAGDHPGPATGWPLWAQVAAALLIFEAINYALHRLCCTNRLTAGLALSPDRLIPGLS